LKACLIKSGDILMPLIRLKMFLIISFALHIVAIFITAAFFHPELVITSPQLIGVGVTSEYKKPGVGTGNDLGPLLREKQSLIESIPPSEALDSEKSLETYTKEKLRPEKRVTKRVVKNQEIPREKAMLNRLNESVDEQSITESSQNGAEGERTNGIASNAAAGTGSSTGVGFFEGVSAEDSGSRAKGSGRGGERAGYPDYKTNPKPRYPMIARRSRYEGVVLLRVWVTESGKVGEIELERSSGYEVLDKSAIEAVKDWIFIPAKKNGVSISSWVKVPIRFELSSG
jgi:TonB family protein